MKKQALIICLQVGCFALCFVMCAMFMFYTERTSIVPQDTVAVNNDLSKKCVILDAGHGGEDSGAVAPDGTLEKDLNLEMTSLLTEVLQCAGFSVTSTRTEDVMLGDGEAGHKKASDLKARVESGNADPSAYYISIHMNKFPKQYCKGIQLFYSPNDTRSQSIATILHGYVKNYLQPDNEREVKNGSQHIYLMDRLKNPAILVECGFVSNPEELEQLKTKEHQKKIALVIMASLCEMRSAEFYG